MSDGAATKLFSVNGGGTHLISDLKSLSSMLKTRRTMKFAYGFMFAFVAFTVFLAFSPSSNSSAPWFSNIFTSPSSSSSYRSPQFSSVFSYFLPTQNTSTGSTNSNDKNPSAVQNRTVDSVEPDVLQVNWTSTVNKDPSIVNNHNQTAISPPESTVPPNKTATSPTNSVSPAPVKKQNGNSITKSVSPEPARQNATSSTNSVSPVPASQNANSSANLVTPAPTSKNGNSPTNSVSLANASKNGYSSTNSVSPGGPNQSGNSSTKSLSSAKGNSGLQEKGAVVNNAAANYTASLLKKQSFNGSKQSNNGLENLINCDLFDGEWIRDDSYPLYKPGSCSLIDEQFNCILNGRPDKDYQKYKWKPKSCSLPRLNPAHMLDLLRGKRLVFVGDSLNRNMWESLVCILKGSVRDPKKVFEANGRHYFRGEAAYSFIFKDYNCTIEFFVSPFLVQEWEMPDNNGTKKETLRLDLVGRSSDQYKSADIIVFNTGHWWTHDKTSKGKDYYQEGSHVYDELNVLEAFRKALTTWGRWVDANVNPMKSLVFFRGYSASHFSGGQWNSGGACDSEVEPIKNATYLKEYPPKMLVLEKVLRGMKTHVKYLNVTQMTDYRKDGHPSIYRKLNNSPEERKSSLVYQDCSHWCLPGVPDTWNEILYAELLINEYQKRQVQMRHR